MKPTSHSALDLWMDVASLSLAALADYLQACSESNLQDRPSCKLAPKQALSSLSRIAEMPCLKDLLARPLIAAFRVDGHFQDRKAALPLPLAALCAWERGICETACDRQLALLLGGLLLAAHASLRFGDLDRRRFGTTTICWKVLERMP